MSRFYLLLGPDATELKMTQNKEEFETEVNNYFKQNPDSWIGIFKSAAYATVLHGYKFYKRDMVFYKYHNRLYHFGGRDALEEMWYDKPETKKPPADVEMNRLLKRKSNEISQFLKRASVVLNKSKYDIAKEFYQMYSEKMIEDSK